MRWSRSVSEQHKDGGFGSVVAGLEDGPGQFFILGQQPVPEAPKPLSLAKRQPCESCERYLRIFSLSKRPIFRV